jgi:hypothetical protein
MSIEADIAEVRAQQTETRAELRAVRAKPPLSSSSVRLFVAVLSCLFSAHPRPLRLAAPDVVPGDAPHVRKPVGHGRRQHREDTERATLAVRLSLGPAIGTSLGPSRAAAVLKTT